jgi:hypothetical protein
MVRARTALTFPTSPSAVSLARLAAASSPIASAASRSSTAHRARLKLSAHTDRYRLIYGLCYLSPSSSVFRFRLFWTFF